MGITSWNFEEELSADKMTLYTFVDLAKKMGCETIEFMGYHLPVHAPEEMEHLRVCLAERHISVSAIDCKNMRFGGKWWERRQDIDTVKLYAQAAAVLGCPRLLLFLGACVSPEGHDAQIAEDICSIREVLDFSEPLGVSVVIENHRVYFHADAPPEENEAEDILRICSVLGKERCAPAPDNDNFYRTSFSKSTVEQQENSYLYYARLLETAAHAHIKLKGFDAQGNHTEGDYRRIAELIKMSGYNGPVSLEFMKPIQEDKGKVLKQALAFFHRAGL